MGPTETPTSNPTDLPTETPTSNPTDLPTGTPTSNPTDSPTTTPTSDPTDSPTETPTSNPTDSPTTTPTSSPTISTDSPTSSSTSSPTVNSSDTASPSNMPTDIPINDGYSIYAADNVEDLYCEGFAWGTDNGSIDAGLKGNELFMVGFMNNFYNNGNVEQVPAAPMCGCIDRMPVVTNAKCLDAKAATSFVNVTYNSALEDLEATFTLGDVTYSECSEGNLLDPYKALAAEGKAQVEDVAFMESRIVGSGNCKDATNSFLAPKGLKLT